MARRTIPALRTSIRFAPNLPPFALSLSKRQRIPCPAGFKRFALWPFDRLRANGGWHETTLMIGSAA